MNAQYIKSTISWIRKIAEHEGYDPDTQAKRLIVAAFSKGRTTKAETQEMCEAIARNRGESLGEEVLEMCDGWKSGRLFRGEDYVEYWGFDADEALVHDDGVYEQTGNVRFVRRDDITLRGAILDDGAEPVDPDSIKPADLASAIVHGSRGRGMPYYEPATNTRRR